MTALDWYAIDFFRNVADQTTANGLPDFASYRAALVAFDYPHDMHGYLMKTAGLLCRLVSKIEVVDWGSELGKWRKDVTIGDVSDELG